jgi:hypothetical protein
MVGTKPTLRPSRLHASRSARTSAISRTTLTLHCIKTSKIGGPISLSFRMGKKTFGVYFLISLF